MFNPNSFASQDTILLLLSFGQSVIFGFLERCLAVFVKFCQSLIASICQDPKVFGKIIALVLEQLKIVFASITKSSGNNSGALTVSGYLRFLDTRSFAFLIPSTQTHTAAETTSHVLL